MKADSDNKAKAHAVVTIPPIVRNENIGSVLNHVCRIMYQTENTDIYGEDYIEWDFKDTQIPHPFFVGILSILKDLYGSRVKCINIPTRIKRFLDTIFFDSHLKIDKTANNDSIWEYFSDKTYTPICEFNPYDHSSIKVQELVQDTIKNQFYGKKTAHSVLSYLLSELIDNITDHSLSNRGFVFSQSIPRLNELYVFIADVGRSIYSSYATDHRYIDRLSNNESSAFLLALKGLSTKNRPENENRGYGISKSRELVVDGLGGEFYILSGSALARHDANGEVIVDLPQDLRWNGTVIFLKIPLNPEKEINIYNYIS